MGLLYKSKYTIHLNPINHMKTWLENRDFLIKMLTKADLHKPSAIIIKFLNQIK